MVPLVVINKADLQPNITQHIEAFCRQQTPPLAVMGHIPFERTVSKAMIEGVTLVEYSSGAAALAVRKTWDNILVQLSLSQG